MGWALQPVSGMIFHQEAQAWFEQSDIDTRGVRRVPGMPTPRAWQVLEQDGRRTQVWRVPGPVIANHMRKRLENLPDAYRAARGFHMGLHPLEPDLNFIQGLGALGGPGQPGAIQAGRTST
jgi:cytidine kinase